MVYSLYYYIYVYFNASLYVGVPFSTELVPEKAQRKSATISPNVKANKVNVEHCGLIVAVLCLLQFDEDLSTRVIVGKEDSELDKELDRLKIERRQHKGRIASTWEEAEVVVKDAERCEEEKGLLLEKIIKIESELDCFNKLYAHHLSVSQREKEFLQENIKIKENELQEAKAKCKEKKKQLEKCKEKIRMLKKRIEEGVRELGERDGRITELEKDKAKAVTALESERMKVRVHLLMRSKSRKP